jgi:hypothetical protein
MVGLTIGIVSVALIGVVFLWVSAIDYMKENYPDYKGEDLFGEDLLDETEKEGYEIIYNPKKARPERRYFKKNIENGSEIKFENVFNEEKKENLKKFISEHKKNIEKD